MEKGGGFCYMWVYQIDCLTIFETTLKSMAVFRAAYRTLRCWKEHFIEFVFMLIHYFILYIFSLQFQPGVLPFLFTYLIWWII